MLAHFALLGYWAGEGPAINRMRRRVSLIAARPSVLLNLPLAEFDALAAQEPGAWRWIALLSTMQLDLAIGVIDDLLIRSPRRRVAPLLLRLAGARENHFIPQQFADIHVSQERLAVIPVLSRTALGDMLREFVAAGIIELDLWQHPHMRSRSTRRPSAGVKLRADRVNLLAVILSGMR